MIHQKDVALFFGTGLFFCNYSVSISPEFRVWWIETSFTKTKKCQVYPWLSTNQRHTCGFKE